VSEAWFGFLGVIVGAAVPLFGEQFVTRREREARQALHEQERRDRRDAFQRDTILALQDAIAAFWPLMMRLREETKHPALFLESVEVTEAHWRINMLRARVFDERLRQLATDIQFQIHAATAASDPDTLEKHALEGDRLLGQMYNRMNTLLEELF
jgi:uncharacterized coiled-coil protein SlyX